MLLHKMFASLKLPQVSRKSYFEAFFTIGGRFFSLFIVIASTKFLTTFLNETDYGQLALYNITAILPSTLYFSPIGQGVLRFFPIAREQDHLSTFKRQLQNLYGWGGLMTLGTGVFFASICWLVGETNWAFACIIIAALNVVNSFNTIWYSLQNVARKRMLAFGLELSDRLLQQATAILLLLFVFRDPLAVITGYLIASIIFLIINRYYYRKSFPQNDYPETGDLEKVDYSKEILRYSWPFILIGIFFWIQNASERWTLEFLKSTETVGQFAVLSQIGFQSLGVIFTSINYFLYPILFNRAGSMKDKNQFNSANRVNNYYLFFILTVSFGTLAVFSIFSESVIRILTNEKYITVAPLLPAMVIAGGFFYFGQYYTNRFMFSLQSDLLILPKVFTAILGIGLNIAGTYYFGLQGLVFSLLFTHALYVAALMLRWKMSGRSELTQIKDNQN